MPTAEEIRARAGILNASNTPSVQLDVEPIAPPVIEQPKGTAQKRQEAIPRPRELDPDQARENAPLAYTDNQPNLKEVNNWLREIEGAILETADPKQSYLNYTAQRLKPTYDVVQKNLEEAAKARQQALDEFLAKKENQTWLNSTVAMLENENIISATMARTWVPVRQPLEGYDPLTDPQTKGYEQYAHVYVWSDHPDKTTAMLDNIQRYINNNEIIANSGTMTNVLSGLLAGVGSPITLAAFVGTPVALGKAAVSAGRGVQISVGALTGTTSAAIEEVILHRANEARTLDESAVNLLANVLLDSTLGSFAAAAKLNGEFKGALKETSDYLRTGGRVNVTDNVDFPSTDADLSAGAAKRKYKAIDTGEFVYTNPVRWVVGNAALQLQKVTPLGRVLQAKSGMARETMMDLAETNIRMTGDFGNIPVESLTRADYAELDSIKMEMRELAKKANQEYGLDHAQIDELFDSAYRRGDISDNPIIEQMAKTQRAWQQRLFERAAELRIKGTYREIKTYDPETKKTTVEVVPLETKTAESYQTRVWDQVKVDAAYKAGPGGEKSLFFRNVSAGIEEARVKFNSQIDAEMGAIQRESMDQIRDSNRIVTNAGAEKRNLSAVLKNYETAIKGNSREIGRLRGMKNPPSDRITELEARIKQIEANRKAVRRNIAKINKEVEQAKNFLRKYDKRIKTLKAKQIDEYTEGQMTEYVDSIYAGVSNLKMGDNHALVKPGAKILKQRLPIADKWLEPFLEKSWEKRMVQWGKTLIPRIRLAEKYGGGTGDFEMTAALRKVKDDYRFRAEEAAEAGNTKLKNQLESEQKSVIYDLELVRDRLLNRQLAGDGSDFGSSMVRTLLNWNSTRMLNGQLISSLVEPSKIVAKYGMAKFTKALAANIKDIKISSIPKNESGRIASATFRAQQIVSANMADLVDVTPTSVLEGVTRNLSNATYTLSGQQHFDVMFKTIAGILSADDMAVLAKTGNVAKLRKIGFDDLDIKVIRAGVAKYGRDVDGIINPHFEQWDSRLLGAPDSYNIRHLQDKIKAVITRDANTTIVLPGAGDRPAFMDTNSGRLLFQFKSFILAATNRTMLPIAQNGADFWKHTTLMTGSGIMAYILYSHAAGREIDYSADKLLIEGMNRGGYLGYSTDLLMTLSKVTGVGPQSSRYYSRSPAGALLGPSYGTLLDVSRAIYSAYDDDSGKFFVDVDSRVHAFRKLLPFQNHFAARQIIDNIEGELAKSMGGTGRYGSEDAGASVIKY